MFTMLDCQGAASCCHDNGLFIGLAFTSSWTIKLIYLWFINNLLISIIITITYIKQFSYFILLLIGNIY